MIPIEDLTDFTLAVEDTDKDDEEDEEDLTDVTLVSDDTFWRLDWCYSSIWGKMKKMKKVKKMKKMGCGGYSYRGFSYS